MKTDIWLESGADFYRETLRHKAREYYLMHRPPAKLDDWLAKRNNLRESILKLAGTMPDNCPLNIKEYKTSEHDGYKIIRLTYQSRPGMLVTANLYVPDGKGPFPGILCTHGHWSQGKIAARVAARGHILAKDGFVALVVDAFGSGERGTTPGEFEYHGSNIGSSLMLIGETLLGMQIIDNMRGIDLLQSLDYVDNDRIGVTGASGGGNQTMWLAALDPRIKASVPVVSVGTFESYVTRVNCFCELLPKGLPLTEEWGVLALAAPNPMLIINALQDSNPAFYVTEMIRSFNNAREIYRLYNADDHFAYKAVNLPHGYWPEMQSNMLGWFRYWFKKQGIGSACRVPDITVLPEEDLLCFPDNNRPPEVKSIKAFVAERAAEISSENKTTDINMEAELKRKGLCELLCMRKCPAGQQKGDMIQDEIDGIMCKKFIVESEPGVLLPSILFLPEADEISDEEITIAVHTDGKDEAFAQPAVQKLLKAGQKVCLVDLRGTGETRWDNRVKDKVTDDDALRAALWLGETIIGNWCIDLSAVRDVLLKKNKNRRIKLMGFASASIAVLAAGALSPDYTGITTYKMPTSYYPDPELPILQLSCIIPGILKWGDISTMINICQCPVDCAQ